MSAQTGRTQVSNDEQAIRQMVDKFLSASQANDLETVLSLLADDVIFMVPGREPFGKEAFRAQSEQQDGHLMEAKHEIKELEVLGDWAWMRSQLEITVTPPNSTPVKRSGNILSILKKNPDGAWVISRDANLLTQKE